MLMLARRPSTRYGEMADALLEAYRTGTPEAMERHYGFTWHRRAWPAMRTYVQLDLGKRPVNPGDDVDITLDDARHLVALEHGFANWRELEAFTKSAKVGPRVVAKPMRLVVGEGLENWQTIAASRDWDEIIQLLAQHPSAGLSADGQMTDAMLADLSRVETLTALGLSGCKGVTDDGIASPRAAAGLAAPRLERHGHHRCRTPGSSASPTAADHLAGVDARDR